MSPPTRPNKELYRLVVTRQNASEILLVARGSDWSLPSAEILPQRRIAEQLCAELYRRCACRGYCLLLPTFRAGIPPCAVMEVPDPCEPVPAGMSWKPIDAAIRFSIESVAVRTVIERSLEELDFYRREPKQGPFARPGYLPELLAWSQQRLDSLGIRLTGSFTQLNASPAFALIRLETSDSAVWFKATGDPNRHELAVTASIARLFPPYIPELLGVHAAWNGWLTRDVPGMRLDHATEPSAWSKAAEDLARLQILSIGNEKELLEGECKDLRLPKLVVQIDPFIDRVREWMAVQDNQTPAPLTEPELTCLGNNLKQACSSLSELGLPNTLGHLDFNPGNIFILPGRSAFLDWAEGCVTNPLVTFEYLREHLRRNHISDTRAIEGIVAAYVRPWESVLSPDALRQAMVLSPLVAVFVHAVAGNTWCSPEEPIRSSYAAYFRSLARRMYRETSQRFEKRELCPA